MCKPQWQWDIHVPALETSVFLIPADFGGRFETSGVKNGEERLVVLNDVAKSIVDAQRGLDDLGVPVWRGRSTRPADRHAPHERHRLEKGPGAISG